MFITIEGIDGCGKSTLATALAHHFSITKKILLTKEPGATELGKTLRSLLQQQTTPVDRRAEFLLFAADRAQHFAQIIMPALAEGTWVISDRCADSSLAYQGYGFGLDLSLMGTVNAWVMHGIQPDLVIYVRVTAATALERLAQRGKPPTYFEQLGESFLNRVVAGYDKHFSEKKNVVIIDGSKSREEVFKETCAILAEYT